MEYKLPFEDVKLAMGPCMFSKFLERLSSKYDMILSRRRFI
jgi:hypothetical protein